MIVEVKSDILELIKILQIENPNTCICVLHQANCFNTLGNAKGIARVLANAFPEIVAADNTTEKGDRGKLSTFTHAPIRENLHVFNCYGQYNYGSDPDVTYTDIESLGHSMGAVHSQMHKFVPDAIYILPKFIGSGLANGDYESIRREAIEPVFSDSRCFLVYN